MNRSIACLLSASVAGSLLLCASADAAVKTWKKPLPNPANKNWGNPNNWSPAGVPGGGDDIVIPADAGQIVINVDTVAGLVFKSFTMLDCTNIDGSHLTSSIHTGVDNNGKARDIVIRTTGAIYIGDSCLVKPKDSVFSSGGTAQPGGATTFESTTDSVLFNDLAYVEGGDGASIGGSSSGNGGAVVVIAKKNLENKGQIAGGFAGDWNIAGTKGGGAAVTAGGTLKPGKVAGGLGFPNRRGDVLINGKQVKADAGTSILGGKVAVLAIGAGGPGEIDFTGAATGTLVAQDDAAIDAGPFGLLNLANSALLAFSAAGSLMVHAVEGWIDMSGAQAMAVSSTDFLCIDAGESGSVDFTGVAEDVDVFMILGAGDGSIDLHGNMVLDPIVDEPLEYGDPPIVIVDSGCALPAPCAGDFNDDGKVDGADLGLLMAAWGTLNAEVDLTGDGQIDGADLGSLLAKWGPC